MLFLPHRWLATPVNYTQGDTPIALSATPNTGLLWYAGPSEARGSPAAPIPSTTAAGTTSHYVSQTVMGCESPEQIDVIVAACTPPAARLLPINPIPLVTPLPLTATGAGLLWYTAASGGGAGSPTAPTPSTTTAGTTSYFVSQTVGGCEAQGRKLS